MGGWYERAQVPACGQVFQVDESGYADPVRQVRDEQFTAELHERAEAMERERAQAVELTKRDAEGARQRAVAERDAKLAELQAKLDASAGERELAAQRLRRKHARSRSAPRPICSAKSTVCRQS